MYDGGKISSVKAKFILKEDPDKNFVVELNNPGEAGDRVKDDLVFSRRIQERGFGLYGVIIQAENMHGNKTEKEWPVDYVVH